jgi:hypothetical protein
MTRFPPERPWHLIILLYVSSVGLLVFWLSQDLPKHTWSIPPEESLTFVEGHFLPFKGSNKEPYQFETAAGQYLEFTCLPELAMATCIKDAGINLRSLSTKESRVGYFHVRNLSAPSLSNVVMTLSADNAPVFTYEESQKNLQQWSSEEKKINHSALTLGSDLLLPLPLFLLALWLTLYKRNAATEVRMGRPRIPQG